MFSLTQHRHQSKFKVLDLTNLLNLGPFQLSDLSFGGQYQEQPCVTSCCPTNSGGTHTLQPHVWTASADVVCLFVQVEEGGKADSLEQPLRVSDEIVIINDIELTGYRQEAVALIKGSYKTLHLTVRRYTRQLLKLKPTKLRQTDHKRLILRLT